VAKKQKRRPSAAAARHARALRKYTPEERARKAEEHVEVPYEVFKEVMRQLVTTPSPKKRGT
jgi:hypothetical protein